MARAEKAERDADDASAAESADGHGQRSADAEPTAPPRRTPDSASDAPKEPTTRPRAPRLRLPAWLRPRRAR